MKKMIYADHAATTKLNRDAFEAMKPFLLEEYGNASQVYAFARQPKQALKEARQRIAACIGALPEEILFTSGGSESDNWVIKEAGYGAHHSGVITSAIEHHAILYACDQIALQRGENIHILPVTEKGEILPAELTKLLSSLGKEKVAQLRLVSLMMANNEIGTIQDIKALASIAHSHHLLFHTDAVQAVGHIPLDVHDVDVDFLSASAHKFNGPKGIGFLYRKQGCVLPPLIAGGGQEFQSRAGTENIAAIVGMCVALEHNTAHLKENQQKLLHLEKLFFSELDKSSLRYKRNGSERQHLPGNISLSFFKSTGESLLHRLDLFGIAVSTGSACNSKDIEVSHVLKAIALEPDWALGTIRISLGYENTEEEVMAIVAALQKCFR